ncbi:MAG TPA: DUF6297 family protein [Streptosporangiaceae bacterium]|nr:DUF6297 family protein [Streptosporangiaceae bacterium]
MTVSSEAIAVPDSTAPTISLLRELRRGRTRQRAASAAYWVYIIVLIVALYGGSQIAAAFHALRHPPPAIALTPRILHAAPAGLAALALILLLVLLRDALWRGPVTLPQVTVDWVLGTPVDRGRLLRPRFRVSAAVAVLAGAAVGVVPAAALVGLGLGGRNSGSVLRLTLVAMLSTALLFCFATGSAALVERAASAERSLRRLTPYACAAAAVLAGMAVWAALGGPAPVLSAIALWSGPWGWAAQGMTALAGGAAPLWPAATALTGVLAVVFVIWGHHAAAGVPGAALRVRARTIGAMSAAVLSMDTRGIAVAYGGRASGRRARLRLRPPRRRELVLLWRDLLALARAPSRLLGAAVLALLAVGLLAVAGPGGQASLVPVATALGLGYLAAAWLCEGARLDAEDTRRSENLPFRFESLAWWHAAVPCLVLLVVAGAPVVAASVATGSARFVVWLVVIVPVLVAGALVNVFRPRNHPDLFGGVETAVGNTAAIGVLLWFVWGPVLAVAPMTVLLSSALHASRPGALTRTVVVGLGLAAGLGIYASVRARRLRSA